LPRGIESKPFDPGDYTVEQTRIDPQALKAAIDTALEHYRQADLALAPFLVYLTPEERGRVPTPPDAFPEAARKLTENISGEPELAQMTGFDGEAVIEDLENVNQLARLRAYSDDLARRVADSRLRWLGEAYVTCLNAYGAARGLLSIKPAFGKIVDALKGIFGGGRRKNAAED
jgi:hypothetical protein